MVINLETHRSTTFKAGSTIVEDVNTWHEAHNPGNAPVTLLAFDLVSHGATNIVRRD